MSWKVKPGDTVKVNQIVVEIETAKALVELPSPFAGVVSELLVAEGTTVDVGTPIITVDDGTGAAPAGTAAATTWRPAVPDPSAIGTPGEDAGRRAGPDRRPRTRRPHLGARRLRPADHHRRAASPQGRRPLRAPPPRPLSRPCRPR